MTEKSALSRPEPKLREASSSGILLAVLGTLAELALNGLPVPANRTVLVFLVAGVGTLGVEAAIGTERV